MRAVQDPTKRAVAAGSVFNAWTPSDPYGAKAWLTEVEGMLPPDLAQFATESFYKKVAKCAPSLAR